MAKRSLKEPLNSLERDIIDTLQAGHSYPQSRSDMQASVRALLRMFHVERLPIARDLEYD